MAEREEQTKSANIRLYPFEIAALKKIAHQISLKTGVDTTWNELVRQAIHRFMRKYEEQKH